MFSSTSPKGHTKILQLKHVLAHYHFSFTEADSRNPYTYGIMSRNSAITETEALVQTTSGVETSRLEENASHCEKIRSEVASKTA